MTRPLKPPRGVFIPTDVIFHPAMTAAVRETLIQIIAIAWRSQNHITPMFSITMLAEITGKSEATLYGHIAVLRKTHAALRLQSAGDGQISIVLAEWLFTACRRRPVSPAENTVSPAPPIDDPDDISGEPGVSMGEPVGSTGEPVVCTGEPVVFTGEPVVFTGEPVVFTGDSVVCTGDSRNLESPDQDDQYDHDDQDQDQIFKDFNDSTIRSDPDENDHHPLDQALDFEKTAQTPIFPKQKQNRRQKTPKQVQKEPAQTRLPKDLVEELEDAGIFHNLLKEVAASHYSENGMRALLAWCQADAPEQPAGLFIWRMRSKIAPPRRFYLPSCPRCGQRGEHAPTCAYRYIDGAYKDLIQH